MSVLSIWGFTLLTLDAITGIACQRLPPTARYLVNNHQTFSGNQLRSVLTIRISCDAVLRQSSLSAFVFCELSWVPPLVRIHLFLELSHTSAWLDLPVLKVQLS